MGPHLKKKGPTNKRQEEPGRFFSGVLKKRVPNQINPPHAVAPGPKNFEAVFCCEREIEHPKKNPSSLKREKMNKKLIMRSE